MNASQQESSASEENAAPQPEGDSNVEVADPGSAENETGGKRFVFLGVSAQGGYEGISFAVLPLTYDLAKEIIAMMNEAMEANRRLPRLLYGIEVGFNVLDWVEGPTPSGAEHYGFLMKNDKLEKVDVEIPSAHFAEDRVEFEAVIKHTDAYHRTESLSRDEILSLFPNLTSRSLPHIRSAVGDMVRGAAERGGDMQVLETLTIRGAQPFTGGYLEMAEAIEAGEFLPDVDDLLKAWENLLKAREIHQGEEEG